MPRPLGRWRKAGVAEKRSFKKGQFLHSTDFATARVHCNVFADYSVEEYTRLPGVRVHKGV